MNFRAFFVTLSALFCGVSAAPALDLILPTANDALFREKPEEFYMYVNRYTDGVKTTPWEGGQYGFVRDMRKTADGNTFYTRFHAGIDIRPLQRDPKGNPLDPIHAIAPGRVVHTNPERGGSNFGCYMVIEHQWDGCPYYSLYAHLSEIHVQPGTEVAQGDKIATMGYTGRGIDRERAHLHLEIGLLLNENFDGFSHLQWGPSGNRHGNFNGINLRGINVARLYSVSKANPKLTIPEFLAKEEVFFHVDIPGTLSVDLLKRYPWMATDQPGTPTEPPAGWRISFSQSGIPLRVNRLNEAVSAMTVAVVKPAELPLNYLTHGLVAGKGSVAALTSRGKQLVSLLTFDPLTAATAAQPAATAEKTHTVKKGESLITIAKAHKVGAEELREVNKIKDPKLLQIGQVLVIPGTKTEETKVPAGELGGE